MRTGKAHLPLHGGKDGHPHPVDRTTYDQSIQILKDALQKARTGDRDRLEALKRLSELEKNG